MEESKMNDRVINDIKNLSTELTHMQWYTQQRLQKLQDNKLKALVAWHAKHGEWFRNRLISADCKPADIRRDNMTALPITSRQDVIAAKQRFFAAEVPKGHGKPGEVQSSGSTGEPVVVKCTDVVSLFFHANNHMEVDWHRRDRKLRMAAVRAGKLPTAEHANWGMPHAALAETGPCLIVNNNTDVKEQARLISEFGTEILSCYPNVMDALMTEWQATNTLPKLKHFKSIGETASDAFKARVREVMGIGVEDSYSSQELGTIANQCAADGLYHTMDYNLIVEVLDEKGNEVGEGETGRVVVTDLHNYASPLVRYDTGDWAVRGGACECGRGLLTLKKIQGRTRNLILRADGSRYWPMVGMYNFNELSFQILRYQVIQTDATTMEYHVLVEANLTGLQRQELKDIANRALGDEFDIVIKDHLTPWPAAPNGKHEEFICRV